MLRKLLTSKRGRLIALSILTALSLVTIYVYKAVYTLPVSDDEINEVLELAYAEAARDAGQKGLNSSEMEKIFVNYSIRRITELLEERGLSNVNVTFTPNLTAVMTPKGYESHVSGEMLITAEKDLLGF